MIIDSLQQESHYYTFCLARTNSIDIAERFPYAVITHGHQIIHQSKKQQYMQDIGSVKEQDVSFNYAFQSVWLKPEGYVNILLANWKKLWESLKIFPLKSLEFSVYQANSDAFLNLDLIFFNQNYAIFQLQDSTKQIKAKKIDFREMKSHSKQLSLLQECDKIVSFSSEFSILSDVHFLRSLVRKPNPLGFYYECPNQGYKFTMQVEVIEILQKICLKPSL